MATIKQKTIFDAGFKSTVDLYEINETVSLSVTASKILTSAPKSPYAIIETTYLPVTSKIVGNNTQNLHIADGERRPGTK